MSQIPWPSGTHLRITVSLYEGNVRVLSGKSFVEMNDALLDSSRLEACASMLANAVWRDSLLLGAADGIFDEGIEVANSDGTGAELMRLLLKDRR